MQISPCNRHLKAYCVRHQKYRDEKTWSLLSGSMSLVGRNLRHALYIRRKGCFVDKWASGWEQRSPQPWASSGRWEGKEEQDLTKRTSSGRHRSHWSCGWECVVCWENHGRQGELARYINRGKILKGLVYTTPRNRDLSPSPVRAMEEVWAREWITT